MRLENRANKSENFQDAIFYHRSCLAKRDHKLFYRSNQTANRTHDVLNNWSRIRLVHEETFFEIKKFMLDKVIRDKHVYALKSIYEMYKDLYDEITKKNYPKIYLSNSSYKQQHLCSKLLEDIPELCKSIFKGRTYLHLNDIGLNDLVTNLSREADALSRVRSMAFEIRKMILEPKDRHLPKRNITVEKICEGECNIPIELYTFISCLLSGPRGSKNELKEIRVNSICSSIIFSTTNGATKPSTCLYLGLVAKSITGSRRIVEILNRMGHCISYSAVEELETELAYGNASNSQILPYNFSTTSSTHVAFDNYDKFVETSSGKDTLHDTVRIVYQNTVELADINENTKAVPSRNCGSEIGRKRRKYYSAYDSSIESYVRKSQSLKFLAQQTIEIPDNLKLAIDLNNLWMLHHAFDTTGAYRWFSWNSVRVTDANPVQKIGYLPNMNVSPTSDAVVRKTMKTALTIANECNQKYIVVTYDLAIAPRAFKIQTDQAPEFDRIFIAMGTFHTEMSFFKVFLFFPSFS